MTIPETPTLSSELQAQAAKVVATLMREVELEYLRKGSRIELANTSLRDEVRDLRERLSDTEAELARATAQAIANAQARLTEDD